MFVEDIASTVEEVEASFGQVDVDALRELVVASIITCLVYYVLGRGGPKIGI